MRFTCISRQSSRDDYMWSLHAEGCRDIRADVRAHDGAAHTIVAESAEGALLSIIDEEVAELGWTVEHVKVHGCARTRAARLHQEVMGTTGHNGRVQVTRSFNCELCQRPLGVGGCWIEIDGVTRLVCADDFLLSIAEDNARLPFTGGNTVATTKMTRYEAWKANQSGGQARVIARSTNARVSGDVMRERELGATVINALVEVRTQIAAARESMRNWVADTEAGLIELAQTIASQGEAMEPLDDDNESAGYTRPRRAAAPRTTTARAASRVTTKRNAPATGRGSRTTGGSERYQKWLARQAEIAAEEQRGARRARRSA